MYKYLKTASGNVDRTSFARCSPTSRQDTDKDRHTSTYERSSHNNLAILNYLIYNDCPLIYLTCPVIRDI